MSLTPLPSKEELIIVKEYILLPIMLAVLEKDVRTLKFAPLKMRVVYLRSLSFIQDKVTRELMALRRRLREQGIKVYEQKRTHTGVGVDYLCRGYQHSFFMLWGMVRAEVEKRLSAYLGLELPYNKEASL